MKKLKDWGYGPAELTTKFYSVWRWNHWITTFSLSWYPLDISFTISASLPQFSCAASQSPCVSLPHYHVFSTTEDRRQEQENALWGLTAHCSSMPPHKSAGPNFSCFFTLLLGWYEMHKASPHFSWGLGKYIFLLKNINSFLVLSHQWWTQSFPSSWMYKNVCPAMPDSPCLVIHRLWGHATWRGNKSKQKSSPDILIKLSRIKNRSLDYSKTPNPVKSSFYCNVLVLVLLCLIYLRKYTCKS